MKVVLAGGTGSLGRRLGPHLVEYGHEVVILSRRPSVASVTANDRIRHFQWDGCTVGDWGDELEGSAVINLAGELVDRRPTAANIALLTSSRVDPTRALVAAAQQLTAPIPVWIQTSTLAIYGDAGQALLDESAPPAAGPAQMAGVASAWEAAAADAPTQRLVVLRTGIVLDRDTPAFDRLLGLARWGLGGSIGHGRQWISWIHIDDWLAVVAAALEPGASPPLQGVVHATSPHPVSNRELMAALRRAAHRPWSPPTPTWAVRVGAIALRTDPALALTGRRAVPKRLIDNGFQFKFENLDGALADLTRAC